MAGSNRNRDNDKRLFIVNPLSWNAIIITIGVRRAAARGAAARRTRCLNTGKIEPAAPNVRAALLIRQNANTTAAMTVVYPLFFTMLDWVMFRVPTILPLILKISLFSSQLSSTLKSIPSVEANMAAAKSSA